MTDRAARDKQIETWQVELRALVTDAFGTNDEPQQAIEFPTSAITSFATKFLNRVGEMATSAYVTGRGGIEKMTDASWGKLAKMVAAQDTYGKGFVADLKAGNLSPDEAAARAALYAGATVTAYEQGACDAVGFVAPAQPGEESPCMTNCRCHWDIAVFDDRIEGTWIANDDDRTCPVCAKRADKWAPYVQELA